MLKAIINFGFWIIILLVLCSVIFENLVAKAKFKIMDENYTEVGGESDE